ncbi:MAG: response regulator [Chloroflexi bacterium]|nr:response regulator [Chloroflexota bacterium]
MQDALVIDDNRNTADVLKQMLDVLGLPSRVAYGSSPAMSALRAYVPSLILLDINMPGVAGTEILSYLKREPRLSRIPVIVVTSDDQPETRQRVLKGGALAILIKPVNLEALEGVLRKSGLL